MKDDIKVPLINDKIKYKEEDNNKISKINEDNSDDEEENLLLDKKVDKEVILKNRIISKIFLLFFIQLSITFLFIYYAFNNNKFNDLLKNHKEIFYLSIGLTGIILFSSYKWEILLITVPFNYFFFLIFTLSISYIICKIVILFTFKVISLLWTLILIMILSLSIYSYNFTKAIKIIPAVIFTSLILFTFSIVIKFVSKIPIVNVLLILLCLISLAVYLVYDVLSLIKEKKIDNKHYILVNVYLYGDIFRLFFKLIKFITKNFEGSIDKDGDNILNSLKGISEDVEKGFKELKEFDKKGDSDDDEDDSGNGSDEDNDDENDSDEDKKGKGKKGKKDDKGKKGGKGKDKKDDKGKKGGKGKDKKEDKKDKGKSKNKKEDKKGGKKDDKGKKGKDKKPKKKEKDFWDDEDTDNFAKKAGEFFADMFSH